MNRRILFWSRLLSGVYEGYFLSLVHRCVERRFPESILLWDSCRFLTTLTNIRSVLIDSRVSWSSERERDGQTLTAMRSNERSGLSDSLKYERLSL